MGASTEGGGGGIGGGLDPNSLITRTYSYAELNTMTLDEMRNESGTFSDGNYNFGSYSFSNLDRSLESRSEIGTKATSQGTYTYGGLTWTRHDELHYKWGDGRVNTDKANFSYTKIDEAYSSVTLDGQSASSYASNSTTSSGLFTMTDHSLGNERTFVSYAIMEWEGPPVNISPEALAQARALGDDFQPLQKIDDIDAFFAGWSDSLTAGLSTRARAFIYGEDATKNHKGKYFERGQIFGAVHGVALIFACPCRMGGTMRSAYFGLEGLAAARGAINGAENLYRGNYGAAALDFAGTAGSLSTFLRACFAGDMQVLTRRGWVRFDALTEQDEVASRDESDPHGEVAYKQVEEIFRTTAPILHVHINEPTIANGEPKGSSPRVLRTTAEHPFWVERQGWTAAQDLKPGDKLVTLEGAPVVVNEVYATGEDEPVYNCRVADYHTYFVGQDGWGVAVWAHNAYVNANRLTSKRLTTLYALVDKGGKIIKWGISSNPARRYTQKYLKSLGATLEPIMQGTRRRMVGIERSLVSQLPGPKNFEPWRGSMFPR